MTTYKTVRFNEIDHAQIKAFCDERNWSIAGFLKVAAAGEMNRVVDEENEERDMRQGLDNLVEDPNCDYRLIVRNGNTVSIQNKHTSVVSHFESDALAADHILGEESQAQTPKAFYIEPAGPGKWFVIDQFQAATSGTYDSKEEAAAESQRLNQLFGLYVGEPSQQRINEGLARAYDDPTYLGEESQARPPVVDDTNPTDEEVESYNTWVLVQIADVQGDHHLTDAQHEALAYARQFIGGDD